MAITLQELLVKVSADISSYTAGMSGIKGATEGVDSSVSKLGGSLDSITAGLDKMGSSLTRVGGMLTAAITLPLAGVSLAALKVAGDLEQAKIAFTTMMGSADQAQSHLNALRQFALSTPFDFADLVKASQRLQALGFSAQQVVPTLRAIGDAAAGLGMGSEGIERISLALGQMQAKGKVSAQEMNQLAEAGINAWELLSAALTKVQGKTVTVADAMKMAEKGMIDGTAAVQVLLTGMEEKFGGLMDAQSKSLKGMWENLQDQAAAALGKIGDMLSPLAKSAIESLSNALPAVLNLIDAFTKLPVPLQETALAFAAIAAASGPALLVTGQFATSISSIIKVVESFSSLAGTGGLFGGLTAGAASATAEVSLLSGAIGAVGLALGVVASLGVGAFIGLAQLNSDTAKLRSLNDEFDRFLLSKTEAFTGPLMPGVGAFDAGLKVINEALEKRAIDLDKYNKLMSMLNANMDKFMSTSPEQLKEFGSSLSSSVGIKLPKGTIPTDGTAGPSLIRPKSAEELQKEADKAARELQQQFNNIGVKDLQKQIDEAVKSFNKLRDAGKLTGDQMLTAAAHIAKLREELKGLSGERMVMPAIDPQGLINSLQSVRNELDNAIGQSLFKLRDYLSDLPMMVSQSFKFDTLTAGTSNLEAFNSLLLNTGAGFGANKSKAQDFFDTLNENLGLSREQLQGLENDINKAAADKFFGLNTAAEIRQQAEEAKKFFDIEVASGAPAQKLLEIIDKIKDAQTQLAMAQQAYNAGLLNDYQLQTKKLAALEDQAKKQQEAGQNITVEQSKKILELQKEQAKALVDVYKDVFTEIGKSVNTLFAGAFEELGAELAHGHLRIANIIAAAKKGLFEAIGGLAEDALKAIAKPLTDWLTKTIADAVAPLAAKLASTLGITAAGALAKSAGVQGLSAAEQAGADAASKATLNGIVDGSGAAASAATSAASGASKAASTAASSVMNTVGAVGSAVSAVSGVISNFQMAGMNKSLDLIEHSTRYAQIILQEIHDGEGRLPADVWTLHQQLLDKLDSIADTFATWIQDLEATVRTLSVVGSSGGGGGMETGGAAMLDALTSGFDQANALLEHIRNGIVDVVNTLGGVLTPQAPPEPTTEAPPPPVRDTSDVDVTSPSAAISGAKSALPADNNTVNAIYMLNQTTATGMAAILEQLKSMTSLAGGGGSTGAAGASAGDMTAILRTALGFTAGPQEQANNAIAAAYKTPNTDMYLPRAMSALSEAFSAGSVDDLVAAVDKLPPGAKDIAQTAIGSIDKNAKDALKQMQNALSIASQSIVDNAQAAAGSISSAGEGTAEAIKSVTQTVASLAPTISSLDQQLLDMGAHIDKAMGYIILPGATIHQTVGDLVPQVSAFAPQALTPPGARAVDTGFGPIDPTDPSQMYPAGYHSSFVMPNYQMPSLQPVATNGSGGGNTYNININEPEFTDKNSMNYMTSLIHQQV